MHTDRISIGEEFPGGPLTDHADLFGSSRVPLIEAASCQERDLHGLEEARPDDIYICVALLFGKIIAPGYGDVVIPSSIAERGDHHQTCGLNTGQRINALQ